MKCQRRSVRVSYWALPGVMLALVPANVAGAGNGYKPNPAQSYLLAITGKTGIFSFAGHRHAILASKWSADTSIDPSDLKRSSLTVEIPAASLVVDTWRARELAGLGEGPSDEDVRAIQRKMLGPDVLDAVRYPVIRFTAASAEQRGPGELLLSGELFLHGQRQQVIVPVRCETGSNGTLSVSGRFTVKQTAFGMQPQAVALGGVKVKDEVEIRLHVLLEPAK